MYEREDESNGKQHGNGESDVTVPQGKHPVVDLQGRWDRDNQRGGGEKETEIRVHSADVHVVRPDHETESADGQNRPYHHPISEDVFPRVDTEQVGNNAESRQGDDVDLGMAEKPETALKQHRAGP